MSTRNYSNGEVTVLWQSDLCSHCGNCVDGLPQVFNIERRPWVDIQAASSQEIVNQVSECPTGALTISEDNRKESNDSGS